MTRRRRLRWPRMGGPSPPPQSSQVSWQVSSTSSSGPAASERSSASGCSPAWVSGTNGARCPNRVKRKSFSKLACHSSSRRACAVKIGKIPTGKAVNQIQNEKYNQQWGVVSHLRIWQRLAHQRASQKLCHNSTVDEPFAQLLFWWH